MATTSPPQSTSAQRRPKPASSTAEGPSRHGALSPSQPPSPSEDEQYGSDYQVGVERGAGMLAGCVEDERAKSLDLSQFVFAQTLI
jgi:hypothetical protein